MNSIKAREFLRRHVLGLMAIFIALSGTAVAASDGPTASSSAVSNAKFKKLKQRVAALETKLNTPVAGDIGGTFPNLTINPNAVSTAKLADNSVSAGKLQANSVTDTKIAANAVTNTKIADNAVTETKIADLAVSTAKLADLSVTEPKIAGNAVSGRALANIDIVNGASTAVAANGSAIAGNGGCNTGGQLISGGVVFDSTDNDLSVHDEFNFLGGWFVRVNNTDGAAHNFTPIGYCVP
jgi:hypothetical protein